MVRILHAKDESQKFRRRLQQGPISYCSISALRLSGKWLSKGADASGVSMYAVVKLNRQ